MKIQGFIRRYPVGALAFFISGRGRAAALGPAFVQGAPYAPTHLVLALGAMLSGPSFAGLILTRIVDGKKGLRALFARMGRWRVGAEWYAAAFLIPPAVILTVLLPLAYLVSPAFSPSFLVVGMAYGLLAGFFEEIGWMGYAFPKMRKNRSALSATLILGILHGVWHVAAGYLGAAGELGPYWLPHFVAMWIGGMTALRVLIAWVYVNTESVLLAQLMHASSTGFLAVLSPTPLSPANETLWYALYALGLWIVAAFVALRYGKRLVRNQT